MRADGRVLGAKMIFRALSSFVRTRSIRVDLISGLIGVACAGGLEKLAQTSAGPHSDGSPRPFSRPYRARRWRGGSARIADRLSDRTRLLRGGDQQPLRGSSSISIPARSPHLRLSSPSLSIPPSAGALRTLLRSTVVEIDWSQRAGG